MLLEEELIKRSQQGDLAAFEELVVKYEKKVYTIAYKYMGNPEDASDLAQEAFIKGFQSIKNFRSDASFGTWMGRIVSNCCLDELRKQKRYSKTSIDEEIELQEGNVSKQLRDPNPSPEQLVVQGELGEYLQSLINELKPDYRVVVLMREVQGLSYDEIAERLDCSLGTIKSRLNRARKLLKEQIIKDGRREG